MNSTLLLQATNLCCVRQQKSLFTQLSFQVHANEALIVEGANGTGKSSLLRLLAGIATPATGEIHWHTAMPENLHYISHTNGIKLGLTVKENLSLVCELANQTKNHIDTVLNDLQLLSHQATLTANLSAGQKRRMALARLYLIPKLVWILDEPLTALDAATQALFLSSLENHLSQGGAAIISSHHPIPSQRGNLQILRLST